MFKTTLAADNMPCNPDALRGFLRRGARRAERAATSTCSSCKASICWYNTGVRRYHYLLLLTYCTVRQSTVARCAVAARILRCMCYL